jgi:hypothetical protein
MIRSVAAGAALALCLAAGPVAAEPFENFVRLCVRTNVDQAAAAAAAKSTGWVQLPPETLVDGPLPFEDPSIYLSHAPSDSGNKTAPDLDILVTGWALGEEVFGIEGVKMDVCGVAVLGFDPELEAEEEVWVFSPLGAGFRPHPGLMEMDDAAFEEAVRREKILMASVMESDGTNVLVIGAIRPAE